MPRRVEGWWSVGGDGGQEEDIPRSGKPVNETRTKQGRNFEHKIDHQGRVLETGIRVVSGYKSPMTTVERQVFEE